MSDVNLEFLVGKNKELQTKIDSICVEKREVEKKIREIHIASLYESKLLCSVQWVVMNANCMKAVLGHSDESGKWSLDENFDKLRMFIVDTFSTAFTRARYYLLEEKVTVDLPTDEYGVDGKTTYETTGREIYINCDDMDLSIYFNGNDASEDIDLMLGFIKEHGLNVENGPQERELVDKEEEVRKLKQLISLFGPLKEAASKKRHYLR